MLRRLRKKPVSSTPLYGQIRVAGVVHDSIVDGPSIRTTVFLQGCLHNCKGCHNPETHSLYGGELVSTDTLYQEITENNVCKAVTFSGGDPVYQLFSLKCLLQKLKEDGYNIWMFTGFLFEELTERQKEVICDVDVLVDGLFVEELKSMDLVYKGSANQRIISIPRTMVAGKVVLSEHDSKNLLTASESMS